ncbi:hypothetical protein [Photobacterium sp. J15]|uniref:hypothetical protein n=1 Tax=Photobacterium sp. J15 TaxID=265901 RepID=UPI0007E41FE9|nr:hypothetical protein [Photobacterium sp. J15]
MDKKISTKLKTASMTAHDSIKKTDKVTRVLLHILQSPHGVTEKSINRYACVMSGRNYISELERKHGITFVKPRLRLLSRDGSYYSIYQLLDSKEAIKLAKLLRLRCIKLGMSVLSRAELETMASAFPDRSEQLVTFA